MGLFDFLFQDKGTYGETLTVKKLKWQKRFGREGHILRNVYVPKEDGTWSEIDVLFITQKGIFVLESKNYSGWIFGDEKSFQWTAMLPNKEKHRFYNPVSQNRNHIKWLNNYLQQEVPMFSLIVFSERCELKKVSVDIRDVSVIKRDDLGWYVKAYWEQRPDVLSTEQMQELYDKLLPLTNKDESMKARHVENIKEQRTICPKCGGKLVLRMAKNGPNAGNEFYGCSNYPKCKHIENINKE